MKVKKQSQSRASEDTEEVIEVAETTETAEVNEQEGDELVTFALTTDIAPPPKVGKHDLLKSMGISVLKKGVVKIPRSVAEVLADKKYGSII